VKELDAATEQALDWMIRLSAVQAPARSADPAPKFPALPHSALEQERERFRQWCAASSANEAAWRNVSGRFDGMFANIREFDARLPGQAVEARQTLLQPPRRRWIGKVLGLSAATVGAGIYVDRSQPLFALGADLHTATAQRASFALPDGSNLKLNARSAVDLAFDGNFRRVHLRQGALIARVAADAARPFIVETEHGTVRALGSRFMVRVDRHSSFVAVLKHAVAVRAADDGLNAASELSQGEGVDFDRKGVSALQQNQSGQAAWGQGWVELLDAPLPLLVDSLRSYYPGHIHVSDAARKVRVQGVFSLDQPLRTLTALQETLAVDVRHFGQFLVTIDCR
jgi:transmembrane sensor